MELNSVDGPGKGIALLGHDQKRQGKEKDIYGYEERNEECLRERIEV